MAQRICIDGTVASRRYRGMGAHRYLTSLLDEMERTLRDSNQVRVQVLMPSLRDVEQASRTQGQGFEFVSSPLMRLRPLWKLGQACMMTAKRLQADVVFLPFSAPVYFKTARLAVTIHDLIPLLFSDQYRSPSGRFLQHCVRTCLTRADLILTDSEHSKADMVSRFGVAVDRVVVAYIGFDSDLFGPGKNSSNEWGEVVTKYGIRRPYVLHVGRLEPRKNLVRLVEACRLLKDRGCDFQLVLCGPPGPASEDLLQLIRKPGTEGWALCTGAVPDCDLAVLYRQASCCAMPSLYEGFGLPVLEAMASGCPVMSSNRSSLPEVAGGAALYFDPESVEEMSAVLEKLLTDSVLRETLAKRGLERARSFSWRECARTTLAALTAL